MVLVIIIITDSCRQFVVDRDSQMFSNENKKKLLAKLSPLYYFARTDSFWYLCVYFVLCLYNHIIFLFWSVSVLTVFFRYCVRFFVNPHTLSLSIYIHFYVTRTRWMNFLLSVHSLPTLPWIYCLIYKACQSFWCFTCVVYCTDNTHTRSHNCGTFISFCTSRRGICWKIANFKSLWYTILMKISAWY